MSDELDRTWRDHLVTGTSSLAALIPVVGAPLAELLIGVLPQMREDRIVEYLRRVREKVDALEGNMESILTDKENIDLIETGGSMAARATTHKRIARIAEIVSRGLTSKETAAIRRKRLLVMFGEIDDDEFLLLKKYYDVGPAILGERDASGLGATAYDEPSSQGASEEGIDKSTLYEAGKQHLLQLGLIERRYPDVEKGEYPPYDPEWGGFHHIVMISQLGVLLLREAGVKSESCV